MTQLKIITFGDPILLKKTAPVDTIDKEIKKLIRNMFETMYNAPGIGLAANQVAVPLNLCVLDIKPGGKTKQIVLINPEIKNKKGRTSEEEGCLSLPGIFVKVPRWEQVTVTGVDENGHPGIGCVMAGNGEVGKPIAGEVACRSVPCLGSRMIVRGKRRARRKGRAQDGQEDGKLRRRAWESTAAVTPGGSTATWVPRTSH